MARRLGFSGPLPQGPSLALGAGEVTLLELAAAYSAPATTDAAPIPYGILEIRDRSGATLYRRSGSGAGRTLSRGVARDLDRMLAAVVDSGTGRAASLDGHAAGKTGTSQDSRDAWFVGYRPWPRRRRVGRPRRPAPDGRRLPAGGLPAEIWRDFMTRYPP